MKKGFLITFALLFVIALVPFGQTTAAAMGSKSKKEIKVEEATTDAESQNQEEMEPTASEEPDNQIDDNLYEEIEDDGAAEENEESTSVE